MKKRLFSVLLATAMVASMATGATCTTVSAAEKKTIKFFHRFPDEPFNSFIEDKIARLNARVIATRVYHAKYKVF